MRSQPARLGSGIEVARAGLFCSALASLLEQLSSGSGRNSSATDFGNPRRPSVPAERAARLPLVGYLLSAPLLTWWRGWVSRPFLGICAGSDGEGDWAISEAGLSDRPGRKRPGPDG